MVRAGERVGGGLQKSSKSKAGAYTALQLSPCYTAPAYTANGDMPVLPDGGRGVGVVRCCWSWSWVFGLRTPGPSSFMRAGWWYDAAHRIFTNKQTKQNKHTHTRALLGSLVHPFWAYAQQLECYRLALGPAVRF
jgi:hypothetical protein